MIDQDESDSEPPRTAGDPFGGDAFTPATGAAPSWLAGDYSQILFPKIIHNDEGHILLGDHGDGLRRLID